MRKFSYNKTESHTENWETPQTIIIISVVWEINWIPWATYFYEEGPELDSARGHGSVRQKRFLRGGRFAKFATNMCCRSS